MLAGTWRHGSPDAVGRVGGAAAAGNSVGGPEISNVDFPRDSAFHF